MMSASWVVSQAGHCADLFRLGRDVEAALLMVDLFEAALASISLLPADRQTAFAQVLEHLLHCQERQDWLGVADGLDVEFISLFQPA